MTIITKPSGSNRIPDPVRTPSDGRVIESFDTTLRLQSSSKDESVLSGSLVIATAGMNKAENFFIPEETLRAAAPLFENAKMFVDHEPRDWAMFDRGFEEEAGFISNVKFNDKDKRLEADFNIFRPDIAANLRARSKAGNVESARISLSALSQIDFEEMQTSNGLDLIRVLREIKLVESVDLVAFDLAGGHLVTVQMSAAQADAFAKFRAGTTTTIQVSADPGQPTPKEDPVMSDKEKPTQDPAGESAARLSALETKIDSLLEQNKSLVADLAAKDAEVVRANAARMVGETDLPDVCKKNLLDLAGTEGMTIEAMELAIDQKKTEIEAVRASLKDTKAKDTDPPASTFRASATDLGATETHTDTDEKKIDSKAVFRASLKNMFLKQGHSEEAAEAMAEKGAA